MCASSWCSPQSAHSPRAHAFFQEEMPGCCRPHVIMSTAWYLCRILRLLSILVARVLMGFSISSKFVQYSHRHILSGTCCIVLTCGGLHLAKWLKLTSPRPLATKSECRSRTGLETTRVDLPVFDDTIFLWGSGVLSASKKSRIAPSIFLSFVCFWESETECAGVTLLATVLLWTFSIVAVLRSEPYFPQTERRVLFKLREVLSFFRLFSFARTFWPTLCWIVSFFESMARCWLIRSWSVSKNSFLFFGNPAFALESAFLRASGVLGDVDLGALVVGSESDSDILGALVVGSDSDILGALVVGSDSDILGALVVGSDSDSDILSITRGSVHETRVAFSLSAFFAAAACSLSAFFAAFEFWRLVSFLISSWRFRWASCWGDNRLNSSSSSSFFFCRCRCFCILQIALCSSPTALVFLGFSRFALDFLILAEAFLL